MKSQKGVVAEELHKPARRNYTRRHVVIRGLDETWQADLVDMSTYAHDNKGYNYLLTIIDIFSKYAWSVPSKTKNGKDITQAIKSVLKQGRIPKNLHVDQGKEFYNKNFNALMEEYGINMYSTYSNLKASICERFNHGLKNKMWPLFTLNGSYKWTGMLNDLMLKYNDTKHRTIKMKPRDVNKKNEKYILHHVYGVKKTKSTKIKFRAGDKVRISRYKTIFEKGYTPNWTTEIFTISEVNKQELHPMGIFVNFNPHYLLDNVFTITV